MTNASAPRGFFVLYVMIAASVFLFLLSTLMSYVGEARLAGATALSHEQALQVADAGLEYYRWHLAHFPSDLEDGTGHAGPYAHDVVDPASSYDAGTFSLSISGESACGAVTSVTVASAGVATSSTASVTLQGILGKPTLAASTSPALSDGTRLTADLAALKTYAQASGIYIASSSPSDYGYQVVMNGDGTMSVAPVTAVVSDIWGYSNEDGWKQENSVIRTVGSATRYSIPSGCPVVFIEDNVWLSGSVLGKVTLAAADLSDVGKDPDLILPGNITYAPSSSTDGLTAIGEHSVLIGLDSPDVMTLSGIFVADKGHFGRNEYTASGQHDVPAAYASDVTRSSISIDGTYASPGSVTLKWTSNGAFISGYSTETDTHDGILAKDPPPFTPETADDLRLLDWRIRN